ncbi:small integral membrane protein 11 isoform X1 [Lagopus muta]|uniref:small integral membrane protein 11 isoform X1 n=1 Tax=Lagopus muta TaxID=64668 RepID=UPI00209FB3F3|nr:small integral membrane protein 11 isoform X1 [Lagopus muta]
MMVAIRAFGTCEELPEELLIFPLQLQQIDASVLDCAFRSVTLVSAGHSLLQNRHYRPSVKMVAFNLKVRMFHGHMRVNFWSLKEALENFPLLMYILAAKTLILCLAFAGVKMYQSKKLEEKLKREREAKLKREAEKKGD